LSLRFGGKLDLINLILHLDQHIPAWIAYFGPWLYVLMFLVIFAETGLVITPFLPGDSLLFALGAFTTLQGGLNLWILLISLTIAAILGDAVNYHVGKYWGTRAFDGTSKLFRKEYLDQTTAFYDKWGAFTIVAARFAPIVRTFAPFVAGVGQMSYRKFFFYNVFGGVIWVFTFILAGHFFGDLPIVKRNFHIVIFGVIGVSLIPIVWPWISHKLNQKRGGSAA
jgi:membrane-associated protein